MKLWSIQPLEIAHALERGERVVSLPDFASHWGQSDDDVWGFRHAYDWMVGQMTQRLGPPPDISCRYPMWAWAKPNPCNSDGSPDMRSHRCNEPQALLCLDVPSHEVLLSDHGSWHHVLNAWPLCLSEYECDAAEARLTRISGKPFSTAKRDRNDFSNTQLMSELCSQWPLIFEVAPFEPGQTASMAYPSTADPEWVDVSDVSVQACLWSLEPRHLLSWKPVAPKPARKISGPGHA